MKIIKHSQVIKRIVTLTKNSTKTRSTQSCIALYQIIVIFIISIIEIFSTSWGNHIYYITSGWYYIPTICIYNKRIVEKGEKLKTNSSNQIRSQNNL